MTERLNLTTGPIAGQLLRLASPIMFGMLIFTLYLLTDLYFVGRLGPDAIAALSISSNVFFVHLGLSFIIGTGAMALIAQAVGANKISRAKKVFEQSLVLSFLVGSMAAITGFFIAQPYIRFFGGTGMTLKWGVEYFQIYSISLLFLLMLHVFGSCYRGMGDTKTTALILLQSLVLNIVLDPVLIFGFLGFPALGVKGAALASLISQIYGVLIFAYLVFIKKQHIHLNGPWTLNLGIIKSSLAIGLPSGLAYFLLTANLLITYRVVSPYGTQALAALGIGFRIVQAIYLPSVAIADAMAAIVGQNYGAKNHFRILSTFWTGWRISFLVMLTGTLVCWMFPGFLIHIFSQDPQVTHYGVMYLKIISLANGVVGTILTVSAVFQGIGKTTPTLICALADNVLFVVFVLTLPAYFNWGVSSVWWIKLLTAVTEVL
ncbi:MAG: MATE family efflux transporter, partial [Proteobacteria bacterium]|nr:MATE family efflux transporter [Pseudomonadota bacterium]